MRFCGIHDPEMLAYFKRKFGGSGGNAELPGVEVIEIPEYTVLETDFWTDQYGWAPVDGPYGGFIGPICIIVDGVEYETETAWDEFGIRVNFGGGQPSGYILFLSGSPQYEIQFNDESDWEMMHSITLIQRETSVVSIILDDHIVFRQNGHLYAMSTVNWDVDVDGVSFRFPED